jgi:integrase/recombinase XerD
VPALPKTDLSVLASGYSLCARAEGKSPKTISAVTSSVSYLARFLNDNDSSTDAIDIGPAEIRSYILYLHQRRPFAGHPYARSQNRPLSDHTVNCYLRSLRAFWSWLLSEEILQTSPFDKVKVPRASKKVMPTLNPGELRALLAAADTGSAIGYRDYTIMLQLIDTGLRVSELTGLKIGDVDFTQGIVRVLGKGNKERLVPFGQEVQRCLWHYANFARPAPLPLYNDILFLTQDGRKLTRNRVSAILTRYARISGLKGAGRRVFPHMLRHTAAVSFLRNRGNMFALQRMLGHSSLEMTRRYCELADTDVKQAHMTASPADNLGLRRISSRR